MSGHGHVVPNPNGAKARCGGPALCTVCAKELAALEGGPQCVHVRIDPNVRVLGNQTYAGFDDVAMPHSADELTQRQKVLALEEESGLEWDAAVADIDRDNELIYLAVDWTSHRKAA